MLFYSDLILRRKLWYSSVVKIIARSFLLVGYELALYFIHSLINNPTYVATNIINRKLYIPKFAP